jgi:hypothetical protein
MQKQLMVGSHVRRCWPAVFALLGAKKFWFVKEG